MRSFIFILSILCSHIVFSQNQDEFYFTNDGLLVDNPGAAKLRVDKRKITDKKFELVEYVKSGEDWVTNKNKLLVTQKNEKNYSIKIIYKGKLIRTHKIKVIQESSSGYLIKEFDGNWCYRESEVLSIFPLVYHGKVKGFPRYGSPVISWFDRNLRYMAVKQPYIDQVGIHYPENYVENFPQYPGGEKYLSKEIIDKLSQEERIELTEIKGRYYIDFTVFSDGSVAAKANKNNEIEKAIVDVISQLSFKWMPATFSGENVDFKYLFPFIFGETENEHFRGETLSLEQTPEQLDSDSTQVYFLVEKMPVYPGGELGLRKDIANNIHYPVFAQEQAIQGKVYVRFVVDIDGSIKRIRVVKGVHSSLDKEAIRVVKELKKWIPAEQGGRKVRVGYTVPITFILG